MRNQLKHEKKEINEQTNKKEQPRITSTPQSNIKIKVLKIDIFQFVTRLQVSDAILFVYLFPMLSL